MVGFTADGIFGRDNSEKSSHQAHLAGLRIGPRIKPKKIDPRSHGATMLVLTVPLGFMLTNGHLIINQGGD